MQKRIERVYPKLDELNLDAFLVSKPANVRYLSGFTGEGEVLICKDRTLLFTDSRYTEQARQESPDCELAVTQADKKIYDYFNGLGCRNLGFEENHVAYGKYLEMAKACANLSLVPLRNLIEEFRSIKDGGEIERIKRAAAIGDEVFSQILKVIKLGMTERELAMEIEYLVKRKGADDSSFEVVVASGSRASMPHAGPSSRKISRGDILLLDFGCVYEGYCSDMTRTVFVGDMDKKMEEVYDIVLEAQENVLKILRANLKATEADTAARSLIAAKGYGQNFAHSLGHGVGLEVHEAPRLSPTSDEDLKSGMVVTVEPGIYIEGLGGVRIEDLVVIRENGIENLTLSTKGKVVIQC